MSTIRTSKQARVIALVVIVIFAFAYRLLPDIAPMVRNVGVITAAIAALLLSPRGVMMGTGIGVFLGIIVGIFGLVFFGNTPEQSLNTLISVIFLGAVAIPLLSFIQGNLDETGNLRQITERDNSRRGT